jgi:hypothetical protein
VRVITKQLVCLIALVAIQVPPAIAAPPDRETKDLILQRYSLYLNSGRGCSYFANPKTLEKNGTTAPNERFIYVLNAARPDGNDGSLCRGVFRFLWLTVNCRTQVLAFRDSAPSIAERERQKTTYRDPEVAAKICAL